MALKEIKTAMLWEEVVASNEKFARYASVSRIPSLTYRTRRLFNFIPRKGTQEAYRAALAFCARTLPHHFLTLIGETGTGKTHLALGVAWHWLENDMGLVLYFNTAELLDELRRGYGTSSPETQFNFDTFMKWLKTVELLVLDDLGVEKPTEWAAEKLDIIVDQRYLNDKPTVFTTNLSANALDARGQKRLASRLSEGTVVVLKSDDYRKSKGQK